MLRAARNDSLSAVIARSEATQQSRADDAPAIVIHSQMQAVAALTAAAVGRPVILLSAPDAGLYAGPGWWRELIAAARAAVPVAECTAILDCGDDAGAAQAAIRAGVEAIVFTGRADVAEQLADIAAGRGVGLLTERPAAALDLAEWFFADAGELRRRLADILASPSRFC